jgi:hypothetical protein
VRRNLRIEQKHMIDKPQLQKLLQSNPLQGQPLQLVPLQLIELQHQLPMLGTVPRRVGKLRVLHQSLFLRNMQLSIDGKLIQRP